MGNWSTRNQPQHQISCIQKSFDSQDLCLKRLRFTWRRDARRLHRTVTKMVKPWGPMVQLDPIRSWLPEPSRPFFCSWASGCHSCRLFAEKNMPKSSPPSQQNAPLSEAAAPHLCQKMGPAGACPERRRSNRRRAHSATANAYWPPGKVDWKDPSQLEDTATSSDSTHPTDTYR